jgi:hypothetical protein
MPNEATATPAAADASNATGDAEDDEALDLADYNLDEQLHTYQVNKTEVERYIAKKLRQMPHLADDDNRWAKFVRLLRVERYASFNSNTPDQYAYRRMTTIRTEADGLAAVLSLLGWKLSQWIAMDPSDVVELLNVAPGRKANTTAALATTLSRVRTIALMLSLFKARGTDLSIAQYKDFVQGYQVQIEALTALTQAQSEARKNNEDIPETWEEVVQKVLDKFGPFSKQYLVFKLYEYLPLRDDFGEIRIQKPGFEDAHKDSNYLILTPDGPLRVYIYRHKTRNRYGDLGRTLPLQISSGLRHYITEHHLGEGDFLFGGTKLSSYVKDVFKEIGYPKFSINTIRRIHEYENSSLPLLEQVKRAHLAGHSHATARGTYIAPVRRRRTAEEEAAAAAVQEINAVHTAADLTSIREEVEGLRHEVTGLKRKLEDLEGVRRTPNSNGYYISSSSSSANAVKK